MRNNSKYFMLVLHHGFSYQFKWWRATTERRLFIIWNFYSETFKPIQWYNCNWILVIIVIVNGILRIVISIDQYCTKSSREAAERFYLFFLLVQSRYCCWCTITPSCGLISAWGLLLARIDWRNFLSFLRREISK